MLSLLIEPDPTGGLCINLRGELDWSGLDQLLGSLSSPASISGIRVDVSGLAPVPDAILATLSSKLRKVRARLVGLTGHQQRLLRYLDSNEPAPVFPRPDL